MEQSCIKRLSSALYTLSASFMQHMRITITHGKHTHTHTEYMCSYRVPSHKHLCNSQFDFSLPAIESYQCIIRRVLGLGSVHIHDAHRDRITNNNKLLNIEHVIELSSPPCKRIFNTINFVPRTRNAARVCTI